VSRPASPGSLNPQHARAANTGERRTPGRPAGASARSVTLLYLAAACLVVAQVLGVYGLVTRKADLIFSLFMAGFVVASLVLGGMGVYQQLG
jgi:hypothetical protein